MKKRIRIGEYTFKVYQSSEGNVFGVSPYPYKNLKPEQKEELKKIKDIMMIHCGGACMENAPFDESFKSQFPKNSLLFTSDSFHELIPYYLMDGKKMQYVEYNKGGK